MLDTHVIIKMPVIYTSAKNMLKTGARYALGELEFIAASY